ncbi:hypothetical protein V6N00_03785 [Tersicoccus sp. MR15.9]|uniref:hypothetical protein n=1 Tax=Tersicoccus mangrovi TaxID=3121635 RepID=UPI002FE53107
MEAHGPAATCTVCGIPTDRAVIVSALLDPDDGTGLEQASTEVFPVCAAHWTDQVVLHRQALDLAGTVDRFAESGLVPISSAHALALTLGFEAAPGAA